MLKYRISEHLKYKSYIGKALRKYGIENFNITVIDKAISIEELNEKECFWIKQLNTIKPYGYNLCEGGGVTLGYKHKEYSKHQMSLNKKGRYTGEENHFYGKTHSEETKEKMRLAWKSTRSISEEMKQKLRETHKTVSVINLDTGEVFTSCKLAGESIGVNPTQITRVCKGRTKTSGGFRWQYYDEYMAISCQA